MFEGTSRVPPGDDLNNFDFAATIYKPSQAKHGISMSLKTLNYAFKFKSSDFLEIHRSIMEWRGELSVLHNRALSNLFATLAVNMIDRATLNPGAYAGKSPLPEAWSSVWEKQREVKRTGIRNPLVDFEFSISLMPHEGDVYGIVFTERHDWREMWLAKDFVEDFSYWNSGDRPEEFTAEEWENRYATWSALLEQGNYRTPSMCGFYADCTLETEHPTVAQVVAAIPPFEERVRDQARMRVMGAELARRRDEMAATMTEQEKEQIPSMMFGMVPEVESWLRTPDGKSEMDAMTARVSAVLKPEITVADLSNTLPAAPEGATAPSSPDLLL